MSVKHYGDYDTVRTMTPPSISTRQRGMTLIEILVTMVILAIGLLGLAGLMLDGLRNNQSAYLRTQASLYAYDMADRMRLNRGRAIAGDYDGYSTNANNAVAAPPTCASQATGCSATDQVTLDKAEWAQQLAGSGGIVLLPGGSGLITRGAGNLFTVTIQWQETQWNENANKKTSSAQSFALDFNL